MCKLFPVSICMTAVFLASGRAEEPKPIPSEAPPVLRSPGDADTDELDQTVSHLFKAAEHLEAAGLAEEAARLRLDARRRAFGENVLSRKEAELECLQEEVDRLRALTGQIPTVAIEIVAIEVDRAKLGLRFREFDRMLGVAHTGSAVISASATSNVAAHRSGGVSSIVEASPVQLPLFRELREKGAIEVLAHPTVQTVTRRPASISVGGEIPIRVKSPAGEYSLRRVPIGTQIEVVPVVLPNQRMRLQACVELSKISGESLVGDDGTIQPQVSWRRFNTEVELQLGQTLAVVRMVSDSIETVVFITPRLAHGMGTPQAMSIVPSGAVDQSEGANIPADFSPIDWDEFGPVVPVLKRRTRRQ
jgi:hypothetical protein